MTGNNGPEMKISAGAVNVTVWRNEGTTRTGKVAEYNTVKIERNYQDAQGNWKSTGSLRLNDLPKAALALEKAYEYLVLGNGKSTATVK